MKPSLLTKLSKLIEGNPTYIVEGRLNKNLLAADARKYDKNLLDTLQRDKEIKEHFFTDTNGGLVFKKDVFLQFISNKEFLPDSFTKYRIKIGLGSDDGSLLSENGDVVLNWPYKDTILEGGQDKEDQKRKEVFFNEVLAPDQITRLLDDKVFTNWKRFDKDGEHELDELKNNDNLILKGNNLVVLHSLKKRFAGKVKLIYIDPPYNTGGDSFGYNDKFNHSTWLTFMKNRLEIARDLLTTDGAIYIQCDDNEQAYLTVLLDQIFGIENRINTISVSMSTVSGNKIKHTIDGKRFPKTKEYILLYARNKASFRVSVPKVHKSKWDTEYNKIIPEWTHDDYAMLELADKAAIESRINELSLVSLTDYAKEHNIDLTDEWKWDNAYRIFAVEQNESLRKIARLNSYTTDIACVESSRGLLKLISTSFNRDSSRARIELVSAQENGQIYISDTWNDMAIGGGISYEGAVQLKNGKKPEKLIHRIIEASTSPGDIVLDYHLGSGTTAAVAHKMGRQYIGIEQLYYGDNDPTVRLQNVINGDQTGVSKSVDWNGGGSFVYANIMNNANTFRNRVEKAKTDADYIELLNEASSSSFLSYRVDPSKLKEDEFRRLSTAEKRQLLLELIDNNTLYVNYEDINDPIFKVSDSDKTFNKELYKKNTDA